MVRTALSLGSRGLVQRLRFRRNRQSHGHFDKVWFPVHIRQTLSTFRLDGMARSSILYSQPYPFGDRVPRFHRVGYGRDASKTEGGYGSAPLRQGVSRRGGYGGDAARRRSPRNCEINQSTRRVHLSVSMRRVCSECLKSEDLVEVAGTSAEVLEIDEVDQKFESRKSKTHTKRM